MDYHSIEKDQKMLVSLSSCRGVASGIMYGTMWTDKNDIDAYLKDLEEWWEITKKTNPKSSGYSSVSIPIIKAAFLCILGLYVNSVALFYYGFLVQ